MIRWKEWGAFLFLGCLAWGTSFLWIKVALIELGPLTLVAYRLLFGVVAVWVIAVAETRRLTIRRRQLLASLLLGVFNTAIPVTLISWAELRIDSGLTGILNGTMPLFAIVIAHVGLPDDRITLPKAAGLLAGFLGIVILLSQDIGPQGIAGSVWGQLAVVAAAICYAAASVFARRYLRDQLPILTAAFTLSSAFVTLAILAPIVESPLVIPQRPLTWVACAWMGVLGFALAYRAYFYLLNRWGATRTSLVTYVFPVTAVTLGVVFLGEQPTGHVFAGGALVIGGIALVNWRTRRG